MNGRACLACARPLEGRQLKYCADEECATKRKREAWLMKTYGLTLEQFDKIVEFQEGKCPVTGRELFPENGKQMIHVDHDPSAGIVRGVVTAYANTRLIGRLRRWQTAQALADYLRDPPAVKALGEPVIAPGRPAKKRKKRSRK